MKKEKHIEITIKPVFVGKNSAEEMFYKLLRESCRKSVDKAANPRYNNSVVFPDVRAV